MNTLNLYVKDLKNAVPLTLEKELDLGKRIESGDTKARDRLVEANLRYVVFVAKSYQGLGVELEDLIAAGNVGLIESAGRYDFRYGFKFVTYADWYIKAEIHRLIRKQAGAVAVPEDVANAIVKIRIAIVTLQQKSQREPEDSDIAEITSVPVEKVTLYRSLMIESRSLDDQVSEDNETRLMEFLVCEVPPTDHQAEENSLVEVVRRVLGTLSDREESVMRKLYGIGCEEETMQSVGKSYGVTKQAIWETHRTALRKLRNRNIIRMLRKYR